MSIEFKTRKVTGEEFENSLNELDRSKNLDWRMKDENSWYLVRGRWENTDPDAVVYGVTCGNDNESDIIHLRANESVGNLWIDAKVRVQVVREFVGGDLFLGVHLMEINSEVEVKGSRVNFVAKKIPNLYEIEQRYGKKV